MMSFHHGNDSAATAESVDEAAATTNTVHGSSRLSRQGFSLDLRTITQNLPMVLSHLKARRALNETCAAAGEIASLTSQRNVSLIQESDAFLKQRNQVSATIGKLMQNNNADLTAEQETELNEAKETSNQAAEGAAKVDAVLEEIQTNMDTLLAGIPNLLDDVVPDGSDESENEEVLKWGDIQALPKELNWPDGDSFEPLWHDDVAFKSNGSRRK